jgi:hypothetical protein
MLSAKTSLEISKPKIGVNIYEKDENGKFLRSQTGKEYSRKRVVSLWRSK